jgi:hypothetical protein
MVFIKDIIYIKGVLQFSLRSILKALLTGAKIANGPRHR